MTRKLTVTDLRGWLRQFHAQDEIDIFGTTHDDGTGFILIGDKEFKNFYD